MNVEAAADSIIAWRMRGNFWVVRIVARRETIFVVVGVWRGGIVSMGIGIIVRTSVCLSGELVNAHKPQHSQRPS